MRVTSAAGVQRTSLWTKRASRPPGLRGGWGRSGRGGVGGLGCIERLPKGALMKSERGRQVDELFEQALEREPTARASFLDGACAADPSLRRAAEERLQIGRAH